MVRTSCSECGDEDKGTGPGCDKCNHTGLDPEYGCYFKGTEYCPKDTPDGVTMDGGCIFPIHRVCLEKENKELIPGQESTNWTEWAGSGLPFWRNLSEADQWICAHFDDSGGWKGDSDE